MAAEYAIDRQSLSAQVYDYIKKLILSGELRGGEKIPEERVAEKFGVSRTPIREALQRLDQYGLIYLKPRSYAIVVALGEKEAREIAVVRAQLEDLAVGLLCEHPVPDGVQELEELARRCTEAFSDGDTATTFEIDSAFHVKIAQLSNNTELRDLFDRIDARVQLSRLTLHLPTEALGTFIGQHHQIIEAIKSGDCARSKSLMREHILGQLPIADFRDVATDV